MRTFIVAIALLTAASAWAQQTVIRDSSGRTIGTESRDSQGTVTLRNGAGQTVSRSSTTFGTSNSLTTTTWGHDGRTLGTTSTPLR